MTLEVNNETTYRVDEREFIDLVQYCLRELYVSPVAEVNLVLVEPYTMSELHERWLGLPGPTDVMSFPMDELSPGIPGQVTSPGCLGEIVLCPQVAADQARAKGHAPVEEMLLLITHGVLHLLGFDHLEPDEATEMFKLQKRLMLGYLAARK